MALEEADSSTRKLPPGWRWAMIGDVCEYVNRGRAPAYTDASGVPVINQKCVRWHGIDFRHIKYTTRDAFARVDERQRLRDGDVLWNSTGTGTIGRAAIYRAKADIPDITVDTHVTILRPRAILPDLLQLWISSNAVQNRMDTLQGGSTNQVELSRKAVMECEIPLPPPDQQRRIVARIEELFGEIEAGEQELAAAKADLARYRRAVLKAAVTGELTRDWREHNPPKETGANLLARILKQRRARWEKAELAKLRAKGKSPTNDSWKARYPEPVAPKTDGLPTLPEGWVWASPAQVAADERHSLAIGPFGSNLKVSDYRAEGVPLVFVRHIRTKDFNGLSPKFASAEKAAELSAHSVGSGDLLITKMGDPPGDAAVYPTNFSRAIITADCIKLRPHGELLSEYFELAINSPLGGAAFSAITKGVAQQKVTLEAFSAIAVPLPSAFEQRTIVDIAKALLEAGSELCGNIDARIAESARLRQSILAAAFSGKLVAGEAPVSRRRAAG